MILFNQIVYETLNLFLESSIYVIFGLGISGLIRIFLSPSAVAKHLGQGQYLPVIKAAFFGIPLPLCSCGVLPAAVSLKKQGANSGATTAFLISTPESGVDSIAITYALLDPIMTVARPVVAFLSAISAGLIENYFSKESTGVIESPDLSCPVDNCCDGKSCPPETHAAHHTFMEKLVSGLKYAFTDVWYDMASWFMAGLILAGIITALVPEDTISTYLGGGLPSMIIMLIFGIPLYICATASTPIAAALILKGVSPGAALVFLLVGPATNITSLTVLFGTLGKRATLIYLTTISLSAISCGILLDQIYLLLDISAQAVVGQAGEMIPQPIQIIAAVILFSLAIKPVYLSFKKYYESILQFLSLNSAKEPTAKPSCNSSDCDCSKNSQNILEKL